MSNAEAWLKSTSAKQRAIVKDYEAEMKWLSSSEAKQRGAAAKTHALSEFKKRFPRADISKFQVQVDFDTNRKATGRVLFPDGDSSWEDPLIEDRKYWSRPLIDAPDRCWSRPLINASRRWFSNAINAIYTH